MKIGITNLKGGVGKTMLSTNLAVTLAHMGYSVCIIDTDSNQNAVQWNAVRDENLVTILTVGMMEPNGLKNVVQQMAQTYNIIIMDGTPNLSEMNSRIMLYADLLIIPTRPGAHDFRAMQLFMDRVQQVVDVRADTQPLPIYFFLNEFDEHIKMHQTVRDSLGGFEVPIMDSTLKNRTAYGETSLNGSGVYEHQDSKAKDEIIRLTNEIMQMAEKHHLIAAS